MSGLAAVRVLRFRPFGNLNLKLTAIALASGLWALVSIDVSVPHIVSGVPVRVESIPDDLALAEPFTQTISIQVRGATARTRELVAGELSPRIDLFGAFAGEQVIRLVADDIPAPLGVTVERIVPETVSIQLEERVRRQVPISVVVEGSPRSGFEIADKQIDVATAEVSGPRSRVEALASIPTETINVTGRSESVERRVTVLSPDPLLRIESAPIVQMTIVIVESTARAEIAGVGLEVVRARTRVDLNPNEIGVYVSGPASVVASLMAVDFRAEIDVEGLDPRAEDYRLEPSIEFTRDGLAEVITVEWVTPQRLINVHVYDLPVER